ncbi:MAG: YggS family pyridoxal phosphate-dependent enzyme [Sciscionella sp.]
MSGPGGGEQRRGELARALAALRERIAAACAVAGRDAAEVRLLAVTKTFPAIDVALLSDLGLTDFAENRDQEATVKVPEFAGLRPATVARWHMVGHVQRNKARSVVGWSDEVQSVDSARLAEALAKATGTAIQAGERSTELDVLVQASIDGDPKRGGCRLSELPKLAEIVTRSGVLRLRGLMAVAPLGADPAAAFERLAAAVERLRRDYPGARTLSSGMSADLEQAIAHGSTCVRVGTALLGGRPLA